MNRTKIDHLVYACPNLEEGINQVEQVLGVRPKIGGKHPGFGTANALLALGETIYLEIIGPDPDRHNAPLPTLFGIDKLTKPRMTSWAIKERNLEVRVQAIKAVGYPFGEVIPLSRKRPDGSEIAWRLTNPLKNPGDGVIPFMIDWLGQANPASNCPKGCQLQSLRISHPNMDNYRDIFSIMECYPELANGPEIEIRAWIDSPNGQIELF